MSGAVHLADTLPFGAYAHYWPNQNILLFCKEEQA